MYSNELFKKFCRERDLKPSTINGYESALKQYAGIKNLIRESKSSNISLKERLVDFRSFLLDSNLTSTTSKTYFSKVKTFYMHFEVEIPKLPQVKYDKIVKLII